MLDTKIYTDSKELSTEQLEAGVAENEAKHDKKGNAKRNKESGAEYLGEKKNIFKWSNVLFLEDSNKSYIKMADNEVVSSAVTVLLAG